MIICICYTYATDSNFITVILCLYLYAGDPDNLYSATSILLTQAQQQQEPQGRGVESLGGPADRMRARKRSLGSGSALMTAGAGRGGKQQRRAPARGGGRGRGKQRGGNAAGKGSLESLFSRTGEVMQEQQKKRYSALVKENDGQLL